MIEKHQHTDWHERFANGDIEFARNWLHENIWQHASLINSQALMTQATGQGSQAYALLSHLKARYLNDLD